MDDMPPIDSLDGLLTQQQVGELLGVNKATVRAYQRGDKGKPPLPYVRIGKNPFFSKPQVAWWLQKVQELGDPNMHTIRHARRQLGLDT